MSYNNPQGRIEGLGVDRTEGRFTGVFEVSEDDDKAMALDRVVVLLVAARSTKVEHTILDTGDVSARRVLKVSDAMPLTGELREQAITKLSSHIDPDQGVIEWGITPPPDVHVDAETGEVDQQEPEPEPLEATPEAPVAPDPVVEAPAPDIFRPGEQDTAVVGQTRPARRDSQLEKFLMEDYR